MSGTTPQTGLNRNQLTMAIMAWLHRVSLKTPVANDFDACAGFVALAEQDMNERLRARCMVLRTTNPVLGQYVTLPCDYLEAVDVRLQNGPELTYQPRGLLAEQWWARTVQAPGDPAWSGYTPAAVPWNNGQPTFYSIVGGEMELSPFPDNAALLAQPMPNIELAYYQRLNLGMNDTDTNNVLSLYPSCYIYGSLIHAAPFLRDDARVQTWATLYNNAVTGANAEHERSRTQGSRLRAQYRRLA